MRFRFLSLITVLLLAFSACPFSHAESEEAGFMMAGFDGQDTYRQWTDNSFFARMQELTGVRLSFEQYESETAWDAAKAEMASGSAAKLPDVLFKASLTREEEQALLKAGVLRDLAPLLADNCPNLNRILDSHPEVRAAITLPGGEIAALPYVNYAAVQNGIWINRKWLSQLKLEAPADLESLENVLRAFKTRDPNGNGRQDEIPLSFLGIFDLHFLSHAFGFLMNDYHIYARDGQAVFAPLTDEYLQMIRWLHRMYKEELLDRNGFYSNDTMRAVTDSKAPQIYGMFMNPSLTNLVPSEWVADYQLLMPLEYNSSRRYRSLWGNSITGTFAITSACKEPERLLAWVDYLYTEEGSVLASLGRENVDYVIDGDGTWRLTERVNNTAAYTAVSLINSGTVPPGVSSDDFQLRYSDPEISRIVADTIRLNTYCELPFPAVQLTKEQMEHIAPLQNRIGMAVDLQASRWVLGEDEPDDSSVKSFREELERLGLDEFMQFWQQILDQEGD